MKALYQNFWNISGGKIQRYPTAITIYIIMDETVITI